MSVYHDRYRPKSEHESSLEKNKPAGASFIKHSNLNFPRSTRRSSSDNKYSSPSKKRSFSYSPINRRRSSQLLDRQPFVYSRRSGRSKSSSNDIIFVERRHRHGGYKPRHIPPDYEYRGKLKVQCMDKRMHRVPCVYPQPEPMRPIPERYPEPMPAPPPPQPYLPPLICDPPVMHTDYSQMGGHYDCGTMDAWPQPYGSGMMDGQSNYDGSFYSRGYPPIPPGAKLIAQYEQDFDEPAYMPTQQPMQMPMQSPMQPPMQPPMQAPMPPPPMPQPYPCEHLVETCVPRSKVIEVWRKARRSRPKEGPSLDELRKDIINSITSEIKKIELSRPQPTQPVEREVKVIVQPIQPVFYMPKQEPVQPTIIPQPIPQPIHPPPQPPPPQPPSIVYVPRNVYVPVIKPVFVPRERVIVRPQIVQVARPVVIDRPVPVAQRPIVIDRELPIPFPVYNRNQQVGEACHEQYIYRDNLPLAYGGRTGEFATGMNYGYVPVNENYQYVVSGCDDLLRQQLVRGSEYNAYGDCFDEAIAEAESSAGNVHHSRPTLHIPVSIVSSPPPPPQINYANIGKENREALVQTLRKAGTGCTNLEVLDPTIRPCWEPVDAKILIQRYGQNAARFVQSGVSYGYVNSPARVEASGSESNFAVDDNQPQVDQFSPFTRLPPNDHDREVRRVDGTDDFGANYPFRKYSSGELNEFKMQHKGRVAHSGQQQESCDNDGYYYRKVQPTETS